MKTETNTTSIAVIGVDIAMPYEGTTEKKRCANTAIR
jgi:hypothetical protein